MKGCVASQMSCLALGFRTIIALVWMISVITLLCTACAQQSVVETGQDDLFTDLADALLSQTPSGKRIAIRPFVAVDIPIPLADANRFNKSLSSAIGRRFPGKFHIVARDELPMLLSEAESFDQLDNLNKIIRNVQADVMIFGRIEQDGGQIRLSYQSASPVTGELLATSPTMRIPFEGAEEAGMDLNPALTQVAEKLSGTLMPADEILRGAIYFQDSGIQTGLGAYIGKRLESILSEHLAQQSRFSANDYLDMEKGKKWVKKSALLTGRYWEFNDSIEWTVILTIENPITVNVRLSKTS